MRKLVISLALASLTGNVMALPVTIDADSYAVGTNISHPNDQVTLQAIHRSNGAASVDFRDMFIAPAPTNESGLVESEFGKNSFGYIRDSGLLVSTTWKVDDFEYFYGDAPMYDEFGTMTIRFFNPVQYLSIETLNPLQAMAFRAYDNSGALVSSGYELFPRSPASGWRLGNIEISRSQADIAYVVVGGSSAAGFINKFTYDVPAPAPLALLGVGLVCGGIMRSHRRIAA